MNLEEIKVMFLNHLYGFDIKPNPHVDDTPSSFGDKSVQAMFALYCLIVFKNG